MSRPTGASATAPGTTGPSATGPSANAPSANAPGATASGAAASGAVAGPWRVLVVDDDDVFRERLARALRARGAEVHTAADHSAAVAVAASLRLDGAVLDLRMPGRSGLEVLADLRLQWPELRAVVLTGYASLSTAMRAGQLGAAEYLTKPAHADAIWAALRAPEVPAASPPAAGVGPESAREVPRLAPETPSLASVEWLHIQQVLDDCGGNISEAARRLGLHRRSLQRKLGKYPPAG